MAKKSIPAIVPEADDADMFVCFGDRALSFKVDDNEKDNLLGHATALSLAMHALHRVVSRFDFGDQSDFAVDVEKHVQLGLEFLSGVVSELLLEVRHE